MDYSIGKLTIYLYKKNPLIIIMKPKFKVKDIVYSEISENKGIGVVLGVKLVSLKPELDFSMSYYAYKVKFTLKHSSVTITEWVCEEAISLHPELQFGNQFCNICHTGRNAGWEYGIPKCKPTCTFDSGCNGDIEDDVEDFEEDEDNSSSLIKCSKCGMEYDCVRTDICPFCQDKYHSHEDDFRVDDDSEDEETHKFKYLDSYYSLRTQEEYIATQRLALKVRRLILNKFEKFGKLNVKETVSMIVKRQAYILEGKDYNLWGEIDRIILKSKNELLRERITMHCSKKADGHILYDGYALYTTPNENEVEYQIDGPISRVSLATMFRKDKGEKHEKKKEIPYYVG